MLWKQSQAWRVLTAAQPAGGQTEGQPTQAAEATLRLPPFGVFGLVATLLVLASIHRSFDSHVNIYECFEHY